MPSEMEKHIFAVTEVNQMIKTLLDGVPLFGGLYVRGELSNYKIYPSGHHYFTLKDPEGVLRCVMFKSSAMKLRFRPENGMKVILYGRITAFPRDGQYQMYCTSITPEGIGDLHVAFEQLKAKLGAEGLFDEAHKKDLPKYPERIALITSGAGAAVRDMIRILRQRYPVCKVIVMPVRVQGAEAPAEIVGAIRYANQWNAADLIITGRGGGSMEDLWGFNDERVARAIYDSRIPVISAVGHEPDITISDFVADARASTPSNAAEIAVPDAMDLTARLLTLKERMARAMTAQIHQRRQLLEKLEKNRSLQNPMSFVQDKRMMLDYIHQRLTAVAQKELSEKRNTFIALTASLDALSPLNVLARGYAVAKKTDGTIIKSAGDVTQGEEINIRLGYGAIDCVVTQSRESEESAWQKKR